MGLNERKLLKQCLPTGLCLLAVIIILGGVLLPFKGLAGATDRHATVSLDPPELNNDDISAQQVTIGFIGDSITAGVGVPQDQNAVAEETNDLGGNFKAVNEGVSGTTTADWRPGSADLRNALADFRTHKVQVVSIMLGTNDSRDSIATTPADYKANMRDIINAVLGDGINHVIIEYPPYVAPDGQWSGNSQALLQEYQAEIDSLTDNKTVLQGDTDAWDYFDAHRNELSDGVHPNAAGYADLGQLWAEAFMRTYLITLINR